LAALAAVSLVVGSALPTLPALRTRFFADRLSLLIGFSAGMMLATALHELLPEAIEKNHDYAMWGAGAGFLILYLAERLTHFHACRHRDCDVEDETSEHQHDCNHDHQHSDLALASTHIAGAASADETRLHVRAPDAHRAPHSHHTHHHAHGHGHADTMALVGMSIHNIADGLTTAAAFAISQTVGIVVVLAIMLHQMAAGLSLGAIMLRMGRNRRRIWISTAITGSFILWGALIYHFLLPTQSGAATEATTGVVLGLAAGSFLYVAACDLLPEAHAGDEGWSITATTVLGYAFVLIVSSAFGGHGHAH
jgi:zinc transporter ZupT